MSDWSNKLELFGRLMESGNNFRRKSFIFNILLLKTIAKVLCQSIHYKISSIQVYDRRPIPRLKLLLKSFCKPEVMRKTRMLLANQKNYLNNVLTCFNNWIWRNKQNDSFLTIKHDKRFSLFLFLYFISLETSSDICS